VQILKSCNLTLGREERDPIIVDQHLVFCKNWYCAKFKSLNVCIPLCFPVPKILLEVRFRYFNVDRAICRLQLIFYHVFWLWLHKCRKSHVAISEFRAQNSSPKRTHRQQQETKSVQVLLLLIQHGANGLNLLEAQHVVLVEPLLNPAAEAQAVSRVHRIGQEKRTLVHRFIVCSFSFLLFVFLLN